MKRPNSPYRERYKQWLADTFETPAPTVSDHVRAARLAHHEYLSGKRLSAARLPQIAERTAKHVFMRDSSLAKARQLKLKQGEKHEGT